MDPSGIRVGTPALTTRGWEPEEMKRVGGWMIGALKGADDPATINAFGVKFPALQIIPGAGRE